MTDLENLKREIFVLAGYIAPDEVARQDDMSLTARELVARVLSDRNLTQGVVLLIAIELAVYADAHSGRMID